ncbi:hypothetical protein D3C81_1252130 [compost metagenome]
MERLEHRHLPALRDQHLAQLRLRAGPLHVHREFLRGVQRHLVAIVGLHHGEREVDAGGDAGRGPELLLLHEDGVGVQVHAGKQLVEAVAHRPVGSGALAVEQAGKAQQEGPGAYGRHAPHPRRRVVQPGNQRCGVLGHVDDLRRARHHHRVDQAQIECLQRFDMHHRAFRRGYGAPRNARGMAAVAGQPALVRVAGSGPEHGLRPGQVEQTHLGIDHEQNIAWHLFNVPCGWRRCLAHGS